MVLLCFALLRWYPSGLSYFVFGCVMLHVGTRVALCPGLPAARLRPVGAWRFFLDRAANPENLP